MSKGSNSNSQVRHCTSAVPYFLLLLHIVCLLVRIKVETRSSHLGHISLGYPGLTRIDCIIRVFRSFGASRLMIRPANHFHIVYIRFMTALQSLIGVALIQLHKLSVEATPCLYVPMNKACWCECMTYYLIIANIYSLCAATYNKEPINDRTRNVDFSAHLYFN